MSEGLDPEELRASTERVRALLEHVTEELCAYIDILRKHLAAEKRTGDGIQRHA